MTGYCIFGISGGLDSSFNIYIFGDVFLRSFYSIYDFENKRVGLALHTQSKATIDYKSSKWVIVFIVLLVLILILAIIIGVYLWNRKQREAEELKA